MATGRFGLSSRQRPGIGRAAITSLAIIVITMFAISSYYSLPSAAAPQAIETTNQSEDATCASATPVANYSFTSPLPEKQVLLLEPGSTVQVCVTYQTEWETATSFAAYKTQWFSNGELNIPFDIANSTAVPSRYTTQIATQANNATRIGSGSSSVTSVTWTTGTAESSKTFTDSFSAQVLPSRITPTTSMTSFTVLYIITPVSNSTGFYSSFGPAPGLLISVGHGASAVKASDFPFAGIVTSGGPPFPYRATGVAVIGAPVKELNIPRVIGPP